jgi:hypothetical protein
MRVDHLKVNRNLETNFSVDSIKLQLTADNQVVVVSEEVGSQPVYIFIKDPVELLLAAAEIVGKLKTE